MRRVLVLVAALTIGHPAVAEAEVTLDAGMVVSQQGDRVQVSYERYIDDCFELSEDDMQRVYREVDGILPECQDAIFDLKLQTDILVRLIHGDPAIICTGDDCPAEAAD